MLIGSLDFFASGLHACTAVVRLPLCHLGFLVIFHSCIRQWTAEEDGIKS